MSADRIAELERQLAAERQRAAALEQRATSYQQEMERQKQTRLREVEARIDAENFAAHVQGELVKLRHNMIDPQTQDAYLHLTGQLQLHVSRLLPIPPEPGAEPAAAPSTPRASAGESSTSSQSSTTTAGQTSLVGKFYPLRVCPWTDFARAQTAAFAALRGQLGAQAVFPPRRDVQSVESALEDTLPTRFLNTEAFLNHARTAAFLDLAVEKPSAKVLAAYLTAAGQNTAVHFDNLATGVLGSSRTTVVAQETDAEVSAASSAEARAEVDAAASVEADSAAGTDVPSHPANKKPAKPRPDCVVLVRDAWTDRTQPNPQPRRVVVGEHKPCHALRAADLHAGPPLPEDCVVQMAVRSQRRKANKAATRLATNRASNLPSSLPSAPAGRSAAASPTASPTASSPQTLPPTHTYFAAALAQTYHYMTMSGLEYGYLATGETMTFLRIPADEPTTLLYHMSVFVAVEPTDLPQAADGPVYPSRVTCAEEEPEAGTPDGAAALEALAGFGVSQLSSLCLLALPTPVRSPSWVAEAVRLLAPFPQLPRNLRRRTSQSPLGARRRDDSDDGHDEDGGGGGGNAPGGRGRIRRASQRDNKSREPSRLRHVQSAGGEAGERGRVHRVTRAADMLPYCTQKCLLGLTRGLSLDAACPNYAHHAAAAAALLGGQEQQQQQQQQHAITKEDLVRLVRGQIDAHPQNNCCLLDKEGLVGAVGCLLKLSVNGYGYTFVAKGVEAWNAGRLRKETRLYGRLRRQQGVLLPVHLGLAALRAPYPFPARFTVLTHVMLLSYVGEALHHGGGALEALGARLGRDLARDVDATYGALLAWGLCDEDTAVYNATWCAETQRVVKIDLDHCFLDRAVYAAKVQEVEAEEVAEEAAAVEAAETASALVAPAAPDGKRKSTVDATDGVEPAAKKSKTSL